MLEYNTCVASTVYIFNISQNNISTLSWKLQQPFTNKHEHKVWTRANVQSPHCIEYFNHACHFFSVIYFYALKKLLTGKKLKHFLKYLKHTELFLHFRSIFNLINKIVCYSISTFLCFALGLKNVEFYWSWYPLLKYWCCDNPT